MVFVFPSSYIKSITETNLFTVIETSQDAFFINEEYFGFLQPDGTCEKFIKNKEEETSYD